MFKTDLATKQKEEIKMLRNENITLKSQLEKATSNPEKNRHFNSSKSSTPCPFLTSRGWYMKENRCDFKHQEPLRNKQKHLVPCPCSWLNDPFIELG
jgi:hypothetical protein